MKPLAFVGIIVTGLAAFVTGVPVSDNSAPTVPNDIRTCPPTALHGPCLPKWYTCGTLDKKTVEGGKALLQCDQCGIWDVKTGCSCHLGNSACQVWGENVKDEHNTTNYEHGACHCDTLVVDPLEAGEPPTGPDNPGDKCSTVSHHLCATNDQSTIIECDQDHIWKVFKKCPGHWCCRYGNHGYPDCYEQCDPHLPPRSNDPEELRPTIDASASPPPSFVSGPATATEKKRHASSVNSNSGVSLRHRDEDILVDETSKTGVEETSTGQPATHCESGNSIAICKQGSCNTVKKCSHNCCMSADNRAYCCIKLKRERDTSVIDSQLDSSLGTHHEEIYLDGSAGAGVETANDDKEYFHCSNQKDIIVCKKRNCKVVKTCENNCCTTSTGAPYCCIDRQVSSEQADYFSSRSPLYSRSIHLSEGIARTAECTPGHHACAEDGLTLKFCDTTGHWKDTQTCGHSCVLTSGATAHCVYPRNYFDARAPAQIQGCIDGEKHCGTYQGEGGLLTWCTLICQDRRWKVGESCHNGWTCKQVKGQDPECMAPQLDLKPRSTLELRGTCSPNEEGQKKCGSEWWAVICRNGRWEIWKGCQRGSRCTQKPGSDPECKRLSRSTLEQRTEQRACSPNEEGQKKCGSEWWAVICRNSKWEIWKGCQRGRKCNQKPGEDPKCGGNLIQTRGECREGDHKCFGLIPGKCVGGRWYYNFQPCSTGCCTHGRCAPISNCTGFPSIPPPTSVHLPILETGVATTETNLAVALEHHDACIPGHYICSPNWNDLLVCSQDGQWKLSSECGHWCCKFGDTPGTAYCDCRDNSPSISTQNNVGASLAKRQDDKLGPKRCTPGAFSCSRDRSHVVVCNSLRDWVVSADCGGGCCRHGAQPNTALSPYRIP
ncbi:hypothetical protein P154DRAFT_571446 [Amniculicola lignicola CBS 123094]|uniref:Uncharacterized protein n=1 Tax=Amniculicola lignicola CBS 123094 TaxID=1392246 RepID=A0A6A5WWA0_9PLEO|nr:hypothetical protein P154DRAFT_571446 [Amniculicola lignicola CBS 123094]